MPAKKKHLSSSGQRWLKVSAAILGGYLVTVLLQIAVSVHLADQVPALVTSAYLSFFLWVFFMIMAFTFRSGGRAWAVYLGIIAACSVSIYLGLH